MMTIENKLQNISNSLLALAKNLKDNNTKGQYSHSISVLNILNQYNKLTNKAIEYDLSIEKIDEYMQEYIKKHNLNNNDKEYVEIVLNSFKNLISKKL
jgi:hypothetical protein